MFTRALLIAALVASLPAQASVVEKPSDKPLNGIANSLTIYVYPPIHPIDWSTPGNALTSTAGNLISIAFSENNLVQFLNGFHEKDSISSDYKSGIGHTLNHVQCTLPDGTPYDHWASLTGQNFHQVDTDLLIKQQLGVGVLFYNYVDGLILSGAENWERITFYDGAYENGQKVRPRYIQLEITPAQCDEARKMIAFFESFHYTPNTTLQQLQARPSNKLLYFTNMIDPYDSYEQRMQTGQGNIGGGCAPFAAALTKVTGRYEKDFDTLWRTPVTVSDKLIGGWKDSRGRVNRVSLGELLLTPLGWNWDYSREGYRNHHLNLYDPQRIWSFAGEMLMCAQRGNCAAADRAFYASHRANIHLGATQVFRGSYVETTHRTGGEGGGDDVTNTYKVQQPVQGVVWKLEN